MTRGMIVGLVLCCACAPVLAQEGADATVDARDLTPVLSWENRVQGERTFTMAQIAIPAMDDLTARWCCITPWAAWR